MSENYRVAGVSYGPHPEFGAMCVVTLAGGFIDLQSAKTAAGTPSNDGAQSKKSKTPSKRGPTSRSH